MAIKPIAEYRMTLAFPLRESGNTEILLRRVGAAAPPRIDVRCHEFRGDQGKLGACYCVCPDHDCATASMRNTG
jgi:hypothetical protein